jgi:hypothetical protein
MQNVVNRLKSWILCYLGVSFATGWRAAQAYAFDWC